MSAVLAEMLVTEGSDGGSSEIPSGHPASGRAQGVYAAEVAAGSSAWRLGLRSRDIILAVNRKPVGSIAEFERAPKASGDVLALNVLRGDTQLFIVVQ